MVVLLCREPCLSLGAIKEMDWDLEQWMPLVEDRAFLPWLVKARLSFLSFFGGGDPVGCVYFIIFLCVCRSVGRCLEPTRIVTTHKNATGADGAGAAAGAPGKLPVMHASIGIYI